MTKDIHCPPLAPDTWPDEIAHMKTGFAGDLNIYRTMAHHPALLASWNDLRAHIVTENSLGLERLEIVILRVAHRLGSDYEWSHHVGRSRALGMPDERIFAVGKGVDALDPDDALIAQCVDDLLDHSRIDDARLKSLMDLVGKNGVFDMMATVGFYKTLGCIAETFGVPLDDGVSPQPRG